MFDILYLSIFLIPNLINVIIPFIVIFGIIIAFIKMDKDKEIIAIFSLTKNITIFRDALSVLVFLFVCIYFLLNFFYSPIVYEIYKNKEFNLRNSVDLRSINFSNFIEIEKKFILDFDKIDNKYENIYINFIEDNENIIYAKYGEIISLKKQYHFVLNKGYKLTLFKDKIEKLEFNEYNLTFPKNLEIIYNNRDKNTDTLNELIKNKQYKIITERILDIIILISIVILFYNKNIKLNDFKIYTIIKFLCISITVLLIQNFIKNIDINFNYFLLMNLLNLIIIYFFILFNVEKN